ncbi:MULTISPECIES: glutaredoxin family protein [Agarivorans]|jgi:hypothetical protein|uniref:Thioredoxin family protein n=1 Tax=Agarivorans gilvus TaxID=680279 RepID=A0ABQ1HWS8_9ALTE|nr:glutaredoxin family protein [Agarivorans gilvus]GGA92207.1 thioredoxin family protein [Agarivorans gilvus]
MTWILYSTDGCHLCEDAKALILANPNITELHEQDIIEDDALVDEYRYSIPVLCHEPSQQRLNWPFDASQLKQFIENCTC